jgi:uncharacterized protein (DUF486 family)
LVERPLGFDTVLKQVARDALRVLTFRRPSAGVEEHWRPYLAFGLAFTWLAGVGRYWDNPRALPWQRAGLGSPLYVVCLAALLWLSLLPLRPHAWSYRRVLVFVTLTAPPALLYAIPVERFLELRSAQLANAWFLAIVASWRVALLIWFLKVSARLSGPTIVIASMLPLALIMVSLMALNLEHVVFALMAGLREEDRSGNDLAYSVVTLLGILAIGVSPLLVGAYVALVIRAR